MPKMGAGAYLAALPPVLKKQHQEMQYRVYVTDCLKMIAENTANFAKGQYMKARYYDIITPKKQDTRTGDEIVEDIIKRAGLVVKSE